MTLSQIEIPKTLPQHESACAQNLQEEEGAWENAGAIFIAESLSIDSYLQYSVISIVCLGYAYHMYLFCS